MRLFRLFLVVVTVSAMTPVVAAQRRVPTTREAHDARVPLLSVRRSNGKEFAGTATLVGAANGQAYYLTNRHMTPTGRNAVYTLITDEESFEAIYIKSSASADLSLLYAAPANVPPLQVAARPPPIGTLVGIHGWTYGKTFGVQEGYITARRCNCSSCRSRVGRVYVNIGANRGQSGGPIMHNGKIVGLISRTDGFATSGPGITAIRKFMGW